MNRTYDLGRRAKYAACFCVSLALLAMPVCAAKARAERVNLFPRLQAGQTVEYEISYHSDKHIKTESPVIVATPDDSANIDVHDLLHLAFLGVHEQSNHAIIH